MLPRWENPTRAIPLRIQTDPNQPESYEDSVPPLARRPYVARVAHGARVAPSYQKKPLTRHASRAPRGAHEQATERSRAALEKKKLFDTDPLKPAVPYSLKTTEGWATAYREMGDLY